VSATTGRNGVVQFTVVGTSRATRLLQGQQASYSCFRLTTEFGIFTVRGDGYSGTFASHVGLVMWRAGGRLDGCEIGGFGGHRWPDTFAGHTPIELAFDAKARAYFANRAAARDLALFVRTARVQKIRHETARRALRDLRAAYGRELAHSAIRIQAVSPDTLRFSERSTAGRLFTVVVTRGRIKKQNLSPFALVF
jgi:hypothetical protein